VTDDYPSIKTDVLPELTEVRVYSETIEHIKDHHPEIPIELPSFDDALNQTIANPTHVEAGHTGSVVFVDTETTNKSGDPFRVPVKAVSGTSGRVQTAYFARACPQLVDSQGVRQVIHGRST
jgi:hypothetical protein